MVRDVLAESLRSALAAAGVEAPEEIHLERPARREHGDWSSNVALASAKAAGRNPRELGQALVDHLSAAPPAHVTAVELAGPGFVNFRLADSWLHDVLVEVVEAGESGYATPTSAAAGGSTSSSCRPTPPGRPRRTRPRGLLRRRRGSAVRAHRARRAPRVLPERRGTQMKAYADSLAARRAGKQPAEDGYHGDYITAWAAEMPADADPLEWGEERAIADQREVLGRLAIDTTPGSASGHSWRREPWTRRSAT
jgi:arginyl-tRNA synthetase